MNRSSRRRAALVAACATAVLLLAVLGASAQAASLAVCTGADTGHYSPAMTLTSQTGTVTYTDTFSCTSNDPGAATGSTGGTFTGTYSCTTQQSPAGSSGTATFTWADSTTSTFSYTDVNGALLVGGSYIDTLTGTMTTGKFAGATVTEVIASPTLSVLQCLTTGVSDLTGVATLTITGT